MVKKSSFLEKLFGSRKRGAPLVGDGRRLSSSRGIEAFRRGPDRLPAKQPAKSRAVGRGAAGGGVAEGRDDIPPGSVRISSAEIGEILASPTPRPRSLAGGGAVVPPRDDARLTPIEKPVPDPASDKKPDARAAGLSRVLGGRREEAAQALTDGFRDLSGLLKNIDKHMDEQGRRSTRFSENFTDLPEMAKAQVDFMAKISQQLIDQKDKTSELLGKLGGLPQLLDGIQQALERQVVVEERTEKNLEDFRSAMDRIHDSIGTLAKESQAAVKESQESFERSHGRATRVFEETQKQAYATFERTQSAQLEQLSRLVDRTGKMNRGMVIMVALVFASVIALFAVVLGR